MRFWFAVLAGCIAGGCTFPSPDIAEPCVAPAQCQTDAQNCGMLAQQNHTACQSPMTGACKPDPGCVDCDQRYQSDLNNCVSVCIACSDSKACYNANTTCQGAVVP